MEGAFLVGEELCLEEVGFEGCRVLGVVGISSLFIGLFFFRRCSRVF